MNGDAFLPRRDRSRNPCAEYMADMDRITVLGIETSCDETAAAVVCRRADGTGAILSNVIRARLEEHLPYGGVVPEIAARAHAELIEPVIRLALEEAGVGIAEIDGVAATAGPGLIGGLIVGLTAGKAIAMARGLPFVGVNHLEAHALTARLTDALDFPYLLLLVSGGHTQLLRVDAVGLYRRLGTTLDDALGEAFDKVAKLMGLPYPGGPEIERRARQGRVGAVHFPRPMVGREEPHFSFAGLKTAIRLEVQKRGSLSDQDVADIARGFQDAVCDVIADRTTRALDSSGDGPTALVVAGGVAANAAIRATLGGVASARGLLLVAPPAELCTDNGAMIAWAGAERLALGLQDGWSVPARPRWPLDPDAPPVIGAGVKA